jgi:opacity protein-like surface antigen
MRALPSILTGSIRGIAFALPNLRWQVSHEEVSMIRSTAILIALLSIGGVNSVYAQDASPGPGTLEVTVIPAGGTFFTSGTSASRFGNYTLGGAVTYNIDRLVGVEGEVSSSLGIAQDLRFGGLSTNQKTPDTLAYTANLVLSLPTDSSLVPYATGGVGGLTMFNKASLGINSNQTFLTGNVGGGLKWYAPNGRWGLRGDYRFMVTQSQSTAPAFFGQDKRYGHRVYVGAIINAVR